MATAVLKARRTGYTQWTNVYAGHVECVQTQDGTWVEPKPNNDNNVRYESFYMNAADLPADFPGATITLVQINVYSQGSGNEGTYFTFCTYGVNQSLVFSGAPAPSNQYVTMPRQSGSWTTADFTDNFSFGVGAYCNGQNSNSGPDVEFINLIITYTPVTPPVAAFTYSTTTGTAPLVVDFTDQTTNNPTSWSWAFGDGETSNLQSPQHIYDTTATTTYTVTMTATNVSGTDSEEKLSLITVEPAVVSAAAAFTAFPTSGVQNLGVQFYDGSTGTPAISTWTWAFGDTVTSTESQPTHTYTSVGTYTVTLTVQNTTPTTSTATRTNYITVLDGKPIPAIRVNTKEGMRPLTVEFTGIATNAVPTQWLWDFGDTVSSQLQNPVHQYLTAGDFNVKLTVSNVIGTNSTTVFVVGTNTTTYSTISVSWDYCTASFYGEPIYGYTPLTVRFVDESLGDAFDWYWQFGDGSTSTDQYPVHTYTAAGTWTATLTVTLSVGPVNAYWSEEEPPENDTLTRDAYICAVEPDNSWGVFLHDLKLQLMDPLYDGDIVDGFARYGGVEQMMTVVQKRLERFVLLTGCLRQRATLTYVYDLIDENHEDYQLPPDLIELLRVEVNGQVYYPADEYQTDIDPQDFTYILGDNNILTMPGFHGNTADIVIDYSYVPGNNYTSPTLDCPTYKGYDVWGFFPLPYVLWWIIRYGVMADLFNTAGEFNDPERAAKCEELFQQGVDIYNTLYRGF